MPKLQFGDNAYRIVDAGEGGELVEYGLAATLTVGLHRYVAVVGKEGEDVVSLLPDGEWLIDGQAVKADQEDVVFKGSDGETMADPEEEEESVTRVAARVDDDGDGDEDDEDEDEDEGDGDDEDLGDDEDEDDADADEDDDDLGLDDPEELDEDDEPGARSYRRMVPQLA